MQRLSMVGVALVATCVASCGSSDTPETSGAPPSTVQAAQTSTAPTAGQPAPRAGRDVSALKACEIVTPQEVASIVGGKLLNEPPAGFANCAYVIEVGGGTESYRLAFSEPQLYTAMFDLPDFKQTAQRLTGLWDEAYVHPRDTGGFSVVAVRRGDIALEAWGDRKEPVVEIAKLAVSRVK